eukprot:scaffold5024_cov136-Cylindrotheca_fusiformis.AAC.44
MASVYVRYARQTASPVLFDEFITSHGDSLATGPNETRAPSHIAYTLPAPHISSTKTSTMLTLFTGFLLLLSVSFVFAQDVEPISIKQCRLAGFDPMQLSCSTCDVLPESAASKCHNCCQSFWNVETKIKRYEAAVLLHVSEENFYPEIDQVFKEDVETIQEKKGKDRFYSKKMSSSNFLGATPPMILWFNEIPRSNANIQELRSKAVETVNLNGWKRDDARDMLLTLLPDIKV